MKNESVKKVTEQFIFLILTIIAVSYSGVLLIFSSEVKQFITASVENCMNIIIPSLFAFMAVSRIIISGGLYTYISKPFTILSKYVIGIPPQLFFVLLMGNLAGYPIGIQLLSQLVEEEKIPKRTAEIMSCFCYCGGPAFYTGTVGLALFGSTRVGMLIFISILISNLLTACVLCRICKPVCNCEKVTPCISAEIFTDSIIGAGKSLFAICAMIVFFSTFSAVLDSCGEPIKSWLNSDNGIIFRSAIEITGLTQLSPYCFDKLEIITAVCSFGGLCIIMQICAICRNTFSLKWFILSRPFSAVSAFFVCKMLKPYFIPKELETFAHSERVFVKINNFVPSLCLILMILLLILKKRLVFSKTI